MISPDPAGGMLSRTFMSYAHLRLHGLEIIGLAGLGLSTHPLAGPLFEPTDPLVHVHIVKRRKIISGNRDQRL